MIRRKEQLNKENKYSYAHPESKFKGYLKAIPGIENASVRENARRKVKAAQQAQQIMRENIQVSSPKKADLSTDGATLAPPPTTEDLSRASSISSSVSVENYRQTINLEEFLHTLTQGREKCELIWGNKEGTDIYQTKRFGVGASKKIPGCYKENLDSTYTRGSVGWSEFVITYDNKFILNHSSRDIETMRHGFNFNHQTMGYGTFLKAAGKIKIIPQGKIIILPSSDYLELGWNYFPIILFVLREKRWPIENILVVDEQGDVPYLLKNSRSNALHSKEKEKAEAREMVSFYLDEKRFPSAKAIAENKQLDVKGMLSKLLLDIDDSILNTKNKKTISKLRTKKDHLKTAIVDFLLLLIQSDLCKLEDMSIEGSFFSIIKSIQSIKKVDHNVDLNFVKNELDTWLHYLFVLSFQTEIMVRVAKKRGEKVLSELFDEVTHLEVSLKEMKVGTMPQRYIDEQDLIKCSFIRFYSENPTKTCIALLRDYTKGGFFWRLLTGAWRRHHIKVVNLFLKKYDDQQYPDNLSIQAIYQELFNQKEGTLTEYSDKKGSLFKRLLFCEKLEKGSTIDTVVPIISKALSQQSEEVKGFKMVPSLLPITEEPINNKALSFASSQMFFVEEKLDNLSPLPTSIPAPKPVMVFSPMATFS